MDHLSQIPPVCLKGGLLLEDGVRAKRTIIKRRMKIWDADHNNITDVDATRMDDTKVKDIAQGDANPLGTRSTYTNFDKGITFLWSRQKEDTQV